MQRDSVQNTIKVAVQLCLVCSILVSLAAVILRPIQAANRENDIKLNILKVAGLWEDGGDLEKLFAGIKPRMVDLVTGNYDESIDVDAFDPTVAARDGEVVTNDIASIKRRESHSRIYEVDANDDGIPEQIIVPVRGYGLWSTLKGFLALDVSQIQQGMDKVVIDGLTYYDHKETPGLGGEVENERWKALWKGKRAFDQDGNVKIQVAKAAQGEYQVDALSGATITSNGVTNMMTYWLGSEGFGRFFSKLRERSAASK